MVTSGASPSLEFLQTRDGLGDNVNVIALNVPMRILDALLPESVLLAIEKND
jgi:hypothetical protein